MPPAGGGVTTGAGALLGCVEAATVGDFAGLGLATTGLVDGFTTGAGPQPAARARVIDNAQEIWARRGLMGWTYPAAVG